MNFLNNQQETAVKILFGLPLPPLPPPPSAHTVAWGPCIGSHIQCAAVKQYFTLLLGNEMDIDHAPTSLLPLSLSLSPFSVVSTPLDGRHAMRCCCCCCRL